MKYFISDIHFFDAGIIEYCDRPFASVGEMNDALVEKFNAKVDGKGEIYVLGDIMGMNCAFDKRGECSALLERMGIRNPATPFHLILGNHDIYPEADYIAMGFVSADKITRVKIGDMTAMLTHDPCMIQPKNTLAICGHIHTLFKEIYNEERNTLTINVSVEERKYEPVSEAEILKIIGGTKYAI
ncbi:MAG: metallophosphoesterase [Synergistaceae bacterium]|nr:metallophosphoesterase [Synergistaceae bacterium]